jgi:hypothetical protein
MFSEVIMTTVLTHPLHVLLLGMVVSRLAREAFGATTWARQVPLADLPDLRVA